MERKRIMLPFQDYEGWTGGTYYILNIIRALNKIDDRDKPLITIFHTPGSSVELVEKIGYPYLEYLAFDTTLPFLKRTLNRMFYFVSSKTLFKKRLPGKVDNLYPAIISLDKSNITNYYNWIGDFQELYLPQFFSKKELFSRKFWHSIMVRSKMPVVFSSQNALDDFNKFYPKNKNRTAILRFASVIDSKYKDLDINALRTKFKIEKPYFIVTNQFWKHKNHSTIILAFEELLKSSTNVQLVFTGKEQDYRNPEFPAQIKKFAFEKLPADSARFLGFIDRNEQLKLMKESIAIVQPSLFEGWSTVVEDAKAIGKFILLSSLPLHLEQIDKNCMFFEPMDHKALAEKLKKLLEAPPKETPIDYDKTIRDFAHTFLSLFPEKK